MNEKAPDIIETKQPEKKATGLQEQFGELVEQAAQAGARKAPEQLPPAPGGPNDGAKQFVDQKLGNLQIGNEETEPYKREVSPTGNIKFTNKIDGSYTNWEAGKDVKSGRYIEVRDALGTVTKPRDAGGIEVTEPNGQTKVYPKGQIGYKGSVSFIAEDGSKHDRRLDGYRVEKSQDGSAGKIQYPDKTIEEQRKNKEGTVKTTFVDGQKVYEETEFFKPTSITVETISGKKEFKEALSIASYYGEYGDKPIAQSLKFAPPGLSMPALDVPGGKLSFNASSLDIFRPKGNTPNEMYYYSDRDFDFQRVGDDGKVDSTKVPVFADTLNIFRDEKTGAETVALTAKEFSGRPLAYISNAKTENKTGQPGTKAGEQTAMERERQVRSQVNELIQGYMGKDGSTPAGRTAIEKKLKDLGKEAIPELQRLAQPSKTGAIGTIQNLAERILAAPSRQPVSESSIQQMKTRGLDLLLGRSIAHNTDVLTDGDLANLEKLSRNGLPSGIDIRELTERLNNLDKAHEAASLNEKPAPPIEPMSLNETSIWPLPLKSDHEHGKRGAQRAEAHLSNQETRQLSREMELILSAIYQKDQATSIYADALSRTGIEKDRLKAVALLTDIASSSPNIAVMANNMDFVGAAVSSGAYKNPNFTDALFKRGEDGADVLASIDQNVKLQERLNAAPQGGFGGPPPPNPNGERRGPRPKRAEQLILPDGPA